MKRIILSFTLSVIFIVSYAQKEFAKGIVDTLASPEFHGRGYVNDGARLAATFIENKFKSYGLIPFWENFNQYYKVNVNTFPDSMSVIVDNKHLVTGEDFMVDPYSGSIKGEFSLVWLAPKDVAFKKFIKIQNKKVKKALAKKAILVLDLSKEELSDSIKNYFMQLAHSLTASKLPVIISTNDKFTWAVGPFARTYGFVHIKASLIRNAEKITFNIKSRFKPNYKTQNVVGYVKGKKYPDRFIAFTAHYDHLGRMGSDTYIPGANDNASGIAMILYLAKYYSENPPDYSIVFMAFGGEEIGLVGSKYYVDRPLFPLKKIKFLMNMDLMGTGDEGITVANSNAHEDQFNLLVKINKEHHLLTDIKRRSSNPNSDHYWFTQKGVPAFFVYTLGGIAAYHDIHDKAETLPLTEFNDLTVLFKHFTEAIE